MQVLNKSLACHSQLTSASLTITKPFDSKTFFPTPNDSIEGASDAEGEGVGVTLGEASGEGETEGEGLGVGDCSGVGEGDGSTEELGIGLGETLGTEDSVGEGVGVSVGVSEGVSVGEGDGVGVGQTEGDGNSDGVGVGHAEGEGDGVTHGSGDKEGDTQGEGEASSKNNAPTVPPTGLPEPSKRAEATDGAKNALNKTKNAVATKAVAKTKRSGTSRALNRRAPNLKKAPTSD